jgi:hypothetical protein
MMTLNRTRRATILLARAVLLLLAVAFAGCGGPKVVPNAPVDASEVPAAVIKAAQQRFPGTKVSSAWMTPDGHFELSCKTKQGKLHELVVSPSGAVLEAD